MKKCEIHGAELVKGTAPIFYGMPAAPPEGYLDAQQELFPNSQKFILGGCVMDGESSSNVEFCPKCREAEDLWTGRGAEFKWF